MSQPHRSITATKQDGAERKSQDVSIAVIYVTAHRCAGGLTRKLDLRSGSQRHRRARPSTNTGPTFLYGLFRETAPLSRILRHAGDTEDKFSGGGGGQDNGRWGVKGRHSYQQVVIVSGHETTYITVCVAGRVLPSFLIFEKCLPHVAYKDGVPGNWLFGYSQSCYTENTLFLNWFRNVSISNCGPTGPVILIMDNHDSHTTLESDVL